VPSWNGSPRRRPGQAASPTPTEGVVNAAVGAPFVWGPRRSEIGGGFACTSRSAVMVCVTV